MLSTMDKNVYTVQVQYNIMKFQNTRDEDPKIFQKGVKTNKRLGITMAAVFPLTLETEANETIP